MLQPERIQAYVNVLRDELVPATGCTEPIAIAYGAALLRKTLGEVPETVLAEVSGNIIKWFINKWSLDSIEGRKEGKKSFFIV